MRARGRPGGEGTGKGHSCRQCRCPLSTPCDRPASLLFKSRVRPHSSITYHLMHAPASRLPCSLPSPLAVKA